MNTLFKKTCSFKFFLILFFISNLCWITPANADNAVVTLMVGYKWVNFAGKKIRALAFNNQIPGPTLHFKEGDHVTINVFNHTNEPTSVHWHGLIIPWPMDGAAGLTQAPIPPGGVFHYQFPIKQSGTYWYHSHAGMQQQEGLYGALVIDPKQPRYHPNKEYVVFLSDWSNTPADQIMANLKKDGDYYEPDFVIQASLMHFIQSYRQDSPSDRKDLIMAYQMMETMRMSPYDISDVAYDAFLMNGHNNANPWKGVVKVGDSVRLRIINGSASSYFRIKIPGISLKIISVDGNDIVPYTASDIFLGPGETYDVWVKITQVSPCIIYAQSPDLTGAALGALVTSPQQAVDFTQVKSFPEPKPVMMMMPGMDMSGMSGMSGMNMSTSSSMGSMKMSGTNMKNMNMSNNSSMSSMNMKGMNMSGSSMSSMNMSSSMGSMNMGNTPSKYQNLRSIVKTNDPNKPFTTIKIVMDGYMSRFVWWINGVPEYKAKPIVIEPGKRYRFIFVNNTMMNHPMHVHGHWFILRNGHGAYDPLLHTIDMDPNSTVIADLDADANYGLWYLHCHNLYHMMSGMTTELQYSNSPYTTQPRYGISMSGMSMGSMNNTNATNNQNYVPAIPVAPASIYNSNDLELSAGYKNYVEGSLNTFIGYDNDKLQLNAQDVEYQYGSLQNANLDIFYWHLLSEFWAIKGGINYEESPTHTPYAQPGIGIAGLMPYFIDTDLRTYYHSGSFKLDIDLSRDTQITNNFFIRLGVTGDLATKTVAQDQVGSGLEQLQFIARPYYRIRPGVNLFAEYDHNMNFGAFRTFQSNDGEPGVTNTVTGGIEILF